jgi:hypothetical protein
MKRELFLLQKDGIVRLVFPLRHLIIFSSVHDCILNFRVL